MFEQNNQEINEKEKKATHFDNHFWDKLVSILFITGVIIILLAIAIKWLGFLD